MTNITDSTVLNTSIRHCRNGRHTLFCMFQTPKSNQVDFIKREVTKHISKNDLFVSKVWKRAKVFYDQMKINPPAKQLCHCSNDIWSNGLLEELAFVAETVRLFGTEELRRFSGCKDAIPNQQYYDYYQYKRDCVGKGPSKITFKRREGGQPCCDAEV